MLNGKEKFSTIQFTPGDVVYFPFAKKSARNKNVFAFQGGFGFGILLGTIPLGKGDPTPQELFQIMGRQGFLTFDDVEEFLGKEAAQKAIDAFKDKYYGKEIHVEPPSAPNNV